MRKLAVLGVAVALMGAGVAACGDDGGNGSSGTTDPATQLTGEPIRLMVIGDFEGLGEDFSNLEGGAQAAADAVNRDGGIDGRPVEIETCNADRNANAAAGCARQVVDENYAAVVGAATTQSAAYLPVLEEAGIPSIANFGGLGIDYNSPVAYPVTLGTSGYAVAMGSLAAAAGASDVGVAYVDVEGGALAAGAVSLGLEPNGGEVTNETPVAPGSPDLSTAYAASSSDSDAVVLALTTADATRFVVAARQAGGSADLVAAQAALDPVSIEELGDGANGIYLASYFLPVTEEHSEMDEVRADFDAARTDFTADDVAVNAWMGVQIFALAAAQASEITGPAIKDALDGLGEIDLGVTPPFSFQKTVPGIPTFERTVNPYVLFNQVEDGVTVPLDGEFVNPFEPLD